MREKLIKYLMAYHLEGRKVKPLIYDMREDEELYRRNFK